MSWPLAAAAGSALALLLYWLLVTTEGVFLGRRVVVWLYDLTAHRYDRIKQFDAQEEQFAVAWPVVQAMAGKPRLRVLDVATGTGRVPHALLLQPGFAGTIVGLDASGKMLAQAAGKLAPLCSGLCGRVSLVQQTAVPLPFADESFDAVSCLEALEFFPSDEEALKEMVRVLQPGGFLMTTRRKGWEGKAFLRRYREAAHFERLLGTIGLRRVRSHLWELNYDLVTARKPE